MAERGDGFGLLARTVAACVGDKDGIWIEFHVYVGLLAVAVIFYNEEGGHVELGAKEACGRSRDGVFLGTYAITEVSADGLANIALSKQSIVNARRLIISP